MSPPLLEARGISKAFRGAQALSGVDLTLREGEIHALMGENGAGKSTLIKVLTGVHPPDAGTIQWEGRPIQPRTPHEAEGHGISTVYQEVNLVPNLSIADNLLLGRQPTRLGLIRGGEVRRRASASLTRLGLDLDVRAPLGSCSLAVQQMVAIARALDIQARLQPVEGHHTGETVPHLGKAAGRPVGRQAREFLCGRERGLPSALIQGVLAAGKRRDVVVSVDCECRHVQYSSPF